MTVSGTLAIVAAIGSLALIAIGLRQRSASVTVIRILIATLMTSFAVLTAQFVPASPIRTITQATFLVVAGVFLLQAALDSWRLARRPMR